MITLPCFAAKHRDSQSTKESLLLQSLHNLLEGPPPARQSGARHFARAMMRTLAGETVLSKPETARRFISRADVPGSSRALGWDTMLPTSSCGTRLSPSAIGHTGFTGTSLWIDWERDFYVVFLSNRVHPTRKNEAIRGIRPRVHDAVVEVLAR